MSLADEVLRIFASRGSGNYFGERVTVTEHCLQAAWFATQESAPSPLVVAALLHDIGHLVVSVPDDIADWTSDAHHEEVGGEWLARRMQPEVVQPVRLHVAAKRYLCATDPSYFAKLSDASVVTLRLQGGPMSADEVKQFETLPGFRAAIRLRLWDDQGKVAGLSTPGLETYRGLIDAYAVTPRS